jgi:hypothetical protein
LKNEIWSECDYYLSEILPNEELKRKWWKRINPGLGGRPPQEVFDEDPKVVLKYLIKYVDSCTREY